MFTSTTRRYPDGTPGTKHVTTNCILEIDEARGHRVRAVPTGPSSRPCPACPCSPSWPAATTTGSPGTPDGWCFAERRYLIDLVGDVSQHMLVPACPTDHASDRPGPRPGDL